MTETKTAADETELPRIAARVLLVEDNLVNIEMARAILEPTGLSLLVATNGDEAVAAAASHRFDLILMDLQLPDCDGFEVARRIRVGEAQGRRAPIIALSATLVADDAQRCRDAGMDGHEEKPLTSALLARLTSRWLAGCTRVEPRVSRTLSPERLAGLFRESAARLIADLRAAHGAADRGAVLRAAHTLKSISARVAAAELGRHSADLEAAARDTDSSDLAPLVAAVLGAYAALDPSLRDNAATSAAEPPIARQAAQAGPLVLIVDDEENERFLVRRTLEHAGYRVDECDSGQEAVAYCKTQRPDLVLLDGLMPGMDGIATCRALRAIFPPEELAILMFTGLSDPDWRARALAAGAEGFIEKAVAFGELDGNLRTGLLACGLEPGKPERH